MIEFIYGLIFLELATLAGLIYFYRKSKELKNRPESIELQEFLLDLMQGGALVHVSRISPTDILIRSRRK